MITVVVGGADKTSPIGITKEKLQFFFKIAVFFINVRINFGCFSDFCFLCTHEYDTHDNR